MAGFKARLMPRSCLDARPIRLSSQDIPTPYNGNLENLTIIQPHQIVETAQAIVRTGL